MIRPAPVAEIAAMAACRPLEAVMADAFDAVVIGSGFGGAVMACRLSARGARVLVLERGRRWDPSTYPRKPDDPWLFSVKHPDERNGWLDVRLFKDIAVVQAAGVGGGSLTYSSVALEAPPSAFARGWPPELTHEDLKPHYATAAGMLNLQTVPANQVPQRFRLAREGAERLGYAERFAAAPLAVTFSPSWSYDLPDPFDRTHSDAFVNAHGRQQGTCIHLGNCDIGCDVQAKNTLDLNYLAAAENQGADVRPLHVVRTIGPDGSGFRVLFDRIRDGRLVRDEVRAPRVFLAAGSLGSTELLLRCRDEHRTLPDLSRALGRGWSANANVLTMARYTDAERVQQSVGPTITSTLDFLDGSRGGSRFVVEDDGFPNVLMQAMRARPDDDGAGIASAIAAALGGHAASKDALRGLMVWLGAGTDAGSGTLTLRRPLLTPWRRELDLRWPRDAARQVTEAIADVHRGLSDATGGRIDDGPLSARLRSALTLHPLGGCRIGTTAADGVVDHLGRVFGYPGLHVVDGSIVPVPLGANPALTIAALAERVAAHAG